MVVDMISGGVMVVVFRAICIGYGMEVWMDGCAHYQFV